VTSTGQPAYQFGDTLPAAERLRLLAEVFKSSTRRFLARLPGDDVRRVVDLGCGPGCTTRLLVDLFPSATVVGLDSSPYFIELAGQAPTERMQFTVADVTQPLAGGPYDLAYCRYLLTHLTDPWAALDLWNQSLSDGGVLAIEENEWIRTTQPAFARYLEIVTAMLADSGQRLYVGGELDAVRARPHLLKRSSELSPVQVTDREAARMFLPNLDTWRTRPYVQQNVSASELDELRDELARLAKDSSGRCSITFGLRQLAFERS
jgi:trans-aconitate 2-methyltransferase